MRDFNHKRMINDTGSAQRIYRTVTIALCRSLSRRNDELHAIPRDPSRHNGQQPLKSTSRKN